MAFKRIILVISILLVCSSCKGTEALLSLEVKDKVVNLDPQFAEDAVSKMIIGNIFEGLLIKKPDGSLELGAAESYSISEDGKVYTFKIRSGTFWSGEGGEELCAEDFVFAFKRLFSSASPYAVSFSCIAGAEDIMAGNASTMVLGVKAADKFTLEFTLSRVNPLFLDLLATTPAMPCNQKAFKDSRGKYCLEKGFTVSNGPYFIAKWNGKEVVLKKNEGYVSPEEVLCNGMRINISADDKGKWGDITAVSYSDLPKAKARGDKIYEFESKTWCIVFNQNDKVWKNPMLRKAVAVSIDFKALDSLFPPNLNSAQGFVPPAVTIGGESYREAAGSAVKYSYSKKEAQALLEQGMSSLNQEKLPETNLYIPDSDGHEDILSSIQQNWQRDISAYITLEKLSGEELESSLREGSYQMMLTAFTAEENSINSFYAPFSAKNTNYYGYNSLAFDKLFYEINSFENTGKILESYRKLEALLLSDTVVIPLYTETQYFAVSQEVDGIWVYPFGGSIYIKYAVKA